MSSWFPFSVGQGWTTPRVDPCRPYAHAASTQFVRQAHGRTAARRSLDAAAAGVRGEARLRRHPRARSGQDSAAHGAHLRGAQARRDPAPLRRAAGDRWRACLVVGAQGAELRSGGQAARHPDRGSSARVRQLRRAHPGRRIRRGRLADLGQRHLRFGSARPALAAAQEGPRRGGVPRQEAARAVAPGAHARWRARQGAVADVQGQGRNGEPVL